MKRISLFVLILSMFCGCQNKVKDMEYLICKDSLQYWELYYHDDFMYMYCFNEDGTFYIYDSIYDGNWRIEPSFQKSNTPVVGRWHIDNDSIMHIDDPHRLISRFSIKSFNEDSILLKDDSLVDIRPYIHAPRKLVRVKHHVDVINIGDPGDTLFRFVVRDI